MPRVQAVQLGVEIGEYHGVVRRQSTEDGNVEASGRDLREVPDAEKQNRLG